MSQNFPVTQFPHPALTIPPPLLMSEPGSFAHLTFSERWPTIIRRVIAENQFPLAINGELEALIETVLGETVGLLHDQQAPDYQAWSAYVQPYLHQSWIDVPWFFAEVYFYRCLLEATQYFQPGPWQGVDPFATQKQAGLKGAIADLHQIEGKKLDQSQTLDNSAGESSMLVGFLYQALWGNRADLSLNPTLTAERVQAGLGIGAEQTYVLVDDTAKVVQWLEGRSPLQIDVIADNTGAELLADLRLIEFLLSQQIAHTVRLHLKVHPTFVSDATVTDVHHTLGHLSQHDEPTLRDWATQIRTYMTTGQLHLCDAALWTSPLVFWQMLPSLQQELAPSDLVILKGDANYRRILGDCQWDLTTPFSDIVCYFPRPVLTLRTLKSELVAGLQSTQIEQLQQNHPQWLTNGHWGVIQFATPTA